MNVLPTQTAVTEMPFVLIWRQVSAVTAILPASVVTVKYVQISMNAYLKVCKTATKMQIVTIL